MKSNFKIQNFFKGDISIWILYLIMSVISLVSVYSSIGLYAIADIGSTPLHLFFRHAAFVVASYLVIVFITPLKTETLFKWAAIIFGLSIVLVFLALMQHTRWINIFGIRFQPSETVKLGLTLLLAKLMHTNRNNLDSPQFFGILIVVIGVVSLLIMPENFSTAALIFLASMFAIFFGGIESKMWLKVMGVIGLLGLLMLAGFYFWGSDLDMMRSSTWGNRINAWLNPSTDLTQENMAKMAIASGGLFGNGIGNTIHARLMTQAHNDFIFAIIIEEAGTAAGAFIFIVYTIFFRRCIRLVKKCHDTFSAVIVAGIATIIYFQALVNMSVAVGLLPVTGQTLPFISFGGTAYLILSCGIGMIQCVAYNIKKQERTLKKDETEITTE